MYTCLIDFLTSFKTLSGRSSSAKSIFASMYDNDFTNPNNPCKTMAKKICKKYYPMRNIYLPEDYEGYSFHSYSTTPLPTESLKSFEILKFRDDAYLKYHTNPKFLEKVKNEYGDIAVNNILENAKIKLIRKILGD